MMVRAEGKEKSSTTICVVGLSKCNKEPLVELDIKIKFAKTHTPAHESAAWLGNL